MTLNAINRRNDPIRDQLW